MLEVRQAPESNDPSDQPAPRSPLSRPTGQPVLRRAALAVWLGLILVSFGTWLAVDWPGFCLIGLTTALLFRRERGLRSALLAIRDWLGLGLFLMLWVWSRTIADTLGMPVREASMIAIDRVIGFGELPTHRLQSLIPWDQDPSWWESIFSLNYASHFLVSFSVLGVLYVRDRPRWASYMGRWVLVSCLGLAGYVLLPTVPPWMSSDRGTVAMVYEGLPRSWSAVNIPIVEDLFKFGKDRANPIAAMPSLHAAYPALLLSFFGPGGRRWLQVLLVAYTLFMAWTIVITGQHWVIDIFAGWLVAVVGHQMVTMFERSARNRHT